MCPHYCMANRREKMDVVTDFLFLGSKNHCGWWLQPWDQKTITSWQESDDKPRQCVEEQTYYSANKDPYSQGYGLPSGHIWLWELDQKKAECQRIDAFSTVVLGKTPESPLDNKKIKPVNLKGDQPWIFTRRTDTEAEAPVFWSSDVNRQLTGKLPDAGKDWGQKEKKASEDEMAEWHRWCRGHEVRQIPGDGEGQGGMACCSPWGHKESDTKGD